MQKLTQTFLHLLLAVLALLGAASTCEKLRALFKLRCGIPSPLFFGSIRTHFSGTARAKHHLPLAPPPPGRTRPLAAGAVSSRGGACVPTHESALTQRAPPPPPPSRPLELQPRASQGDEPGANRRRRGAGGSAGAWG